MKIELTKEQDMIARAGVRTLIVKGTAGSGKTLVGLARAERILEDQERSLFNEDKRVLYFSYNNSVINEIRDKSREYCKDRFFDKMSFETYDRFFYDLICDIFKGYYPDFTISTFNKEYFAPGGEYAEFLEKSASDLGLEYSFMLNELRYIMYNGFTKDEYIEFERKNREEAATKEAREKIYSVLEKYRESVREDKKIDIYDAYIWFLDVYLKEYRKKRYEIDIDNAHMKAEGEEVTDEIPNIYEIFSDVKAIIVDESQDLCRIKIKTLLKIMEIFEDINFITFLYDISQSIYESSYFNNITSFKSIGLNARKSLKTLSYSYRSTRQIHQCAYSLLSNYSKEDDANELAVNPIFGQSDEGVKPVLVECPSVKNEGRLLARMINTLMEKYRYTPDDIIVICQNAEEEERYEKIMQGSGLDPVYISSSISREYNENRKSAREENKGKIRIYNPYNVKGLEAKVIFIVGNNEYSHKRTDEENAKFYYVQMTRAMELLFIMTDGEPDKYIRSIDEKYISKVDYNPNLDIDEIIDRDIEMQKEMIETNKISRYAGVAENIEKNSAADKEYQEKMELREQTISKDLFTGSAEAEKYVNKVQETMPTLPDNVIKNLGLGLYYYEGVMDVETAYGKFAKGLELILRKIYNDRELTLGQMVNRLEVNKDYRDFAKEIIEYGFVRMRNVVIHGNLSPKHKDEIENIYNYIFKDNKLVKLYDKILKVRDREKKNGVITMEAYVLTKGCKAKVRGKELYLYLIDNENFGACKRFIKSGKYELEGKYQVSNGMDIFVIENFKECKEQDEE